MSAAVDPSLLPQMSNVISPFFSIALVLAISRLQGVELLGKYSLLMTVFILGQACGTLGLSIIITRETAQFVQREYDPIAIAAP